MRVLGVILTLVLVVMLAPGLAVAVPPDGTMAIGVHVTLVSRWLDPGETEALITPFMVLYALHDALVKPMPGGIMTPSLAESWSASKDGLSYEFVIRKNARFHIGDPVTAEDVKFTFERYKGSGAKLLKDKVKEIQILAPNRVRFVLKEPWPDFMAFYGTSATGAGWIVPKKYIEKVGEEAYKRAPVGAGPFKFISFTPGIELTLEAFGDYWRKAPQVKRLIMRSIPDETTRAAAVKTGEVDAAYLFVGAVAEDLKRSPGVRVVAPLLYGIYWLDFALRLDPPAFDPKRAKQLMVEAGYPNGFDAGDLTPLPLYTTVAEAVGGNLQTIGIRTSVRTMERATFLTAWREKKLHGLLIGATGAAGNAATRLEAFFTKGGTYPYGTRPEIDDLFQRQAGENDRKQREALLHQIQKIIADQTLVAPIFQQAFLWGVGPRVEQPGAGLIQGYPYAAPCEDLKLK